MKIAVLMSGQQRYLEQSSKWWRERCFPDFHKNIEVDYFLHLWDDGTDLQQQYDKVWSLYNPKHVVISKYQDVIEDHIGKIKIRNNELQNTKYGPNWHIVPEYVQHTVCYQGGEISQYTYNFPGMFLATAKIAESFESYFKEYDIAIKTRTDCILNPMPEHHWGNLFGNMLRQPAFNDIIFTPWLRIRNGLPFFGDLCFIGKSHLMQKFMTDMDKHLVKLATDDKHLLSDFMIDPEIPFAHWLWSRLSMYSRTDWLSINVVWPTPFDSCLIRSDEDISDKKFEYLSNLYNSHEEKKHDHVFHKVGASKN